MKGVVMQLDMVAWNTVAMCLGLKVNFGQISIGAKFALSKEEVCLMVDFYPFGLYLGILYNTEGVGKENGNAEREA